MEDLEKQGHWVKKTLGEVSWVSCHHGPQFSGAEAEELEGPQRGGQERS